MKKIMLLDRLWIYCLASVFLMFNGSELKGQCTPLSSYLALTDPIVTSSTNAATAGNEIYMGMHPNDGSITYTFPTTTNYVSMTLRALDNQTNDKEHLEFYVDGQFFDLNNATVNFSVGIAHVTNSGNTGYSGIVGVIEATSTDNNNEGITIDFGCGINTLEIRNVHDTPNGGANGTFHRLAYCTTAYTGSACVTPTTSCTGSQNPSLSFDVPARNCVVSSIIFWIPASDLATYNNTVNGSSGCDFGGLSGANAICNYVANQGDATSFVSAEAGNFVAVLEGDGTPGNPSFFNTYDTNRPLYSSNNEIGSPLTLDDYMAAFGSGASDCDRLYHFYTYNGQYAGSPSGITGCSVHPTAGHGTVSPYWRQCSSCDPFMGFTASPTIQNCSNWTSSDNTTNVSASNHLDYYNASYEPPIFGSGGGRCHACGLHQPYDRGDFGMWCVSQ